MSLRNISEQTPEISIAAVKQDGSALEHEKEQTPEICLAALQNDAKDQFFLGACFEQGFAEPQDFTRAAYWYRKAAEQGHNDAADALELLGQ